MSYVTRRSGGKRAQFKSARADWSTADWGCHRSPIIGERDLTSCSSDSAALAAFARINGESYLFTRIYSVCCHSHLKCQLRQNEVTSRFYSDYLPLMGSERTSGVCEQKRRATAGVQARRTIGDVQILVSTQADTS